MTKTKFLEYIKTDGIYQACLYANMAGVSLTLVQLWIKSK